MKRIDKINLAKRLKQIRSLLQLENSVYMAIEQENNMYKVTNQYGKEIGIYNKSELTKFTNISIISFYESK